MIQVDSSFGIDTHTSFTFLKCFKTSSKHFFFPFSRSSFGKMSFGKIGFRFRKVFLQNIALTLFCVDPWSHTGSIKSLELYFVFKDQCLFCRKKYWFQKDFHNNKLLAQGRSTYRHAPKCIVCTSVNRAVDRL